MGKRSNAKRIHKDKYYTFDDRALPPLLKHLEAGVKYLEPCAGAHDLVDQIDGKIQLNSEEGTKFIINFNRL